MEFVPFQVPRARHLVRHAFRILEGTIIPVGLFIIALHFTGVTGAVATGTAWTYSAIGVRLLTKRHVPGILMLGAVTLTARSVLTFATGSTFVYFLQPTLGTTSSRSSSSPCRCRPVARSSSAWRRTSARSPTPMFNDHQCRRSSCASRCCGQRHGAPNTALTFYLLLSQSVGVFVVTRTIVSLTITAITIAISATWFLRSMRRQGILAARTTGAPRTAAA